MTPPPRPPRRRADPERDRRRYLPRGIAKGTRGRDPPPSASATRTGRCKPSGFFVRGQTVPEGQLAAAAPGPTRSTQPCNDPLPRLGGVRRLRGAACLASMRSAVRGLRCVGIRADPRNQLVHECRHDRQTRHLNNAHVTQLARRHVAMFLQLEIDTNSSLVKAFRPSLYKRQPANASRRTDWPVRTMPRQKRPAW